MTVHQTEIGNVEVLRQGEGAKCMVLLHAAASGPRALYKLGSAVSAADSGWQSAMVGLHGYGATRLTVADPADPFGAHARAATWALRHMDGVAPVGLRVLFGHSMGGVVALKLALAGERIDALILYEPIVLNCLDLDDPIDKAAHAWDGERVDVLREQVAAGNPEAGVKAFIEAFNEVSWEALPPPLRAELVGKAVQLAAETRQAPQITFDRRQLATLPMPILILQGSRSPVVTHRMSMRLAGSIPHAQHQVLVDTGHMGPALSPAIVSAAVRPFLSALR